MKLTQAGCLPYELSQPYEFCTVASPRRTRGTWEELCPSVVGNATGTRRISTSDRMLITGVDAFVGVARLATIHGVSSALEPPG